MIKGSECIILTEDEAQVILKCLYALIGDVDSKGIKKLRELGARDVFDDMRTFVRGLYD